MSKNRIGMLAWGTATVVLALLFLIVVIAAGCLLVEVEKGKSYTISIPFLLGMYIVLKENGGLIAGILAFSGLAWSHFYKAENPDAE